MMSPLPESSPAFPYLFYSAFRMMQPSGMNPLPIGTLTASKVSKL